MPGKKDSKLTILFVGLGSIGQRHMRNILDLMPDSVRIHAVRKRGFQHVLTEHMTQDKDENLETRYNIIVFDDLEEALEQKPDAVFITNPSSLHMAAALATAEAGCHMFIEKPLSDRLDDIDRLAGMVRSKNLVCMVGFQLRFHPCIQLAKSLLDKQAVGNLLSARLEVGEYLPDWHKYEDYRQSYAARKDLGGGVILTLIHELDIILNWFGLPEKAFAVGGHLSYLEIDVPDTASILYRYCRNGRPFPVHVQLDYLQRPPCRNYQILGEKGKIYVDMIKSSVTLIDFCSQNTELFEFRRLERNHLFLDEIKHFFSSMEKKSKPVVDLYTGMASLKMAMAATCSMAQNRPVTVNFTQ